MKSVFTATVIALLGMVVFTACDHDDDDIRVSDVPVSVMNAFQAKFPNVVNAEWEKKSGYYVADFWQEGMETHVWMDKDAQWRMTELDLNTRLDFLPQAVQDAFRNGQYTSWRVDDIDKYERPGDTFYLIEVETNGQRDRDLYYAADGSLLKDEVDKEKEVTPDITF